jgi:hypothetical protein
LGNLDRLLITLVAKDSGPFNEGLEFLLKDCNLILLILNFLVLESEVVLQLIERLGLSLFEILGLEDILLNILNFSSVLLV